MIDTQVHILDPAAYPYPAVTRGYRPRPDETGDLAALLAVLDAHGVARAVLVQASVYGADNAAILDALAAHPERFRCVVSVSGPEGVRPLLARRGVVGVRLNLVDDAGAAEGGPGAAREIAAEVFAAGGLLQLQASPALLGALLNVIPAGPVILDHFGRPDLSTGSTDTETVAAMAARPDTWLKVSAAFRLTPRKTALPRARLMPMLRAFGATRRLWGSDWPFINLANENLAKGDSASRDSRGAVPRYQDTLDARRRLLDAPEASDAAAARLFGWPVLGPPDAARGARTDGPPVG